MSGKVEAEEVQIIVAIRRNEMLDIRERILDGWGALYAEHCFEYGRTSIEAHDKWTSYCDLFEGFLQLIAEPRRDTPEHGVYPTELNT